MSRPEREEASRGSAEGAREPVALPPGADAAAATTGATVLGGSLWQVVSKLAPQVYVVALSVVAARFLGPEGMGRQSFISFAEFVAMTAVTGGIPVALPRFIAASLGQGRPGRVRLLLRWGWRVQAVGALLGGSFLIGVGLTGSEPAAAWMLAGAVTMASVLHGVPSAVLVGTQQWRLASIVGVLTGLVSLIATIVVLNAGGGIVGMFAVEAAVAMLGLVWTGILARRVAPPLGPLPEAQERREVLQEVIPYVLYSSLGMFVSVVVWRRSEFFFLNRYAGDSQIAFYSVAFAAMTALAKLPEAVSEVLMPAVATLHGAGQTERIRLGFGRALRLSVALSMPLVAGAVAVGPALVTLVYGRAFAPVGTPLLILLTTFLLLPPILLATALLNGMGLLKVQLGIGVFAAVVNVVAALVLIPRWGAEGAALANAIAQLAVGIPTYLYARRVVGRLHWDVAALGRAALAALATWLAATQVQVLLGPGVIGVAAAVLAGVAVFVTAALVLRVLPQGDGEWLSEALGARLGPGAGALVRRCSGRG